MALENSRSNAKNIALWRFTQRVGHARPLHRPDNPASPDCQHHAASLISGRGFAVVAGEVRRLAASTYSSTQKITAVIEENNRLISNMYHQLDEIKNIISSENDKISELGRSFQEINSGVNEFSTVIHQLNAQ